MPISTKRWCDQKTKEDGYRLLICRARPKTVPKAKSRWDGWCSVLAPSAALEAQFKGAKEASIGPEEFERRYLEEMKRQTDIIDELARLALEGKSITLLCSTACKEETHCHRSFLKGLIEKRMGFLGKLKN